MNKKFEIFKNGWKYYETICGKGSTLENTKNVLKDLIIIIKQIYNETSNSVIINDAGCGDLWWIKNILYEVSDIVDYHGYDLYERSSWNDLNFNCSKLDISEQLMRKSDLIICRDVFIHFPNDYILSALSLFKQSSQYLYSTTYTGESYEFSNYNRIKECYIHHSKLNLCSDPFNLGSPIYITTENYNTQCCQKLMCLWKL